MSALTTAAIIGLAASAAAGTASAAIQSHQAGKAVDAQTAAGNQALQAQQEQFRVQQQAAAPYQQAGQMTLGRLGQMAAQPANQFNPSNYRGGVPLPSQQMPQGVGGVMGGAAGIGMGGQAAPGQAMGAMQGAAGIGGQFGGTPAPGQTTDQGQNQTVTIQTPDGRVLQGFPRARLQEAMQRGAKVMA